MALDQGAYYHHKMMMAHKGRSNSICTPGSFPSEVGVGSSPNPTNAHNSRRATPPYSTPRENGQSARYRESADYTLSGTTVNMHQGGNPSSPTSSAQKTSPRKTGAHRSQSARVIGSRPRVKRREREVDPLRSTQQHHHLDLASSEGALRDCQESYNPFLRKVPSSGRLITTSNSLEMSNHSLFGTPPPQHQPLQSKQPTPPLTTNTPRDSPKISRNDRRGSDKSTPEKEKKPSGSIPTIATPDNSPVSVRRTNNSKPSGLPKSPQVSRSSSARRSNSVKSPRRNTGFLDVPDSNPSPEDEDEESYRLRSFSVTPKGIVNRGDSFRRRRSRSNSLIPTPATTPELQRNNTFVTSENGFLLPGGTAMMRKSSSPLPSPKLQSKPFPKSATTNSALSSNQDQDDHNECLINHRVAMVGARGVGKAALVSQFMTSECINAYDRQNDVEGEETVSVMLNGEESELTIFKMSNLKAELSRLDTPDAFVIVYSVVDRGSFQRAEADLRRLQEWDLIRTKAIVLVANKIDLARSRAVSTQDGRCLAVSFRVKFIEVSVGINHNVDELLVGVLHQVRLKLAQAGNQDTWCKHRGILRASVKARQMLTWLLGKEDAKFKNCENLHIL